MSQSFRKEIQYILQKKPSKNLDIIQYYASETNLFLGYHSSLNYY